MVVSEIREGNTRKVPPEALTVYINPEITSVSHETELDYEGCGSIAEGKLFGLVKRAREITLTYTDIADVSHETEASGLIARIIQHEVDHLNDILFTDLCDPKSLISREHYLQILKDKST